MRRRSCYVVLTVFIGLFFWVHPAMAQDPSASRMIKTVNGLRAARGLAPYLVDAGLMAYAQEHADYQAASGVNTHQHSDGSFPWDLGSGQEGVAVLAAQPPNAVQPAAPAQSGAFPTATPQPDGSIVHIVQDGDNLATISETYGVSMADIRALNGKAPTSNLIFPGERLMIRTAPPPTETPTITPSLPRPTRTPTPFRATRTPAPTRTASLTPQPTPTVNPLIAETQGFVATNRRWLLFGMGGLCGLGLGWVLWAGFFGKNGKKQP